MTMRMGSVNHLFAVLVVAHKNDNQAFRVSTHPHSRFFEIKWLETTPDLVKANGSLAGLVSYAALQKVFTVARQVKLQKR